MSRFLAAARKHWGLVVSWWWWALVSSFDELRQTWFEKDHKLLTVTASSLTHLLPFSLTSQCTPLPGSLVLLQTHGYFESIMLEQTFGQHRFSCCAPKQQNFLPYDVHYIQPSHAFKIVLKTHLYKPYRNDSKFHLFTCLPPPPYPLSLLITFLLRACVRACVKTI